MDAHPLATACSRVSRGELTAGWPPLAGYMEQLLAAEFQRYVASGFGSLRYSCSVPDPDALHDERHGGYGVNRCARACLCTPPHPCAHALSPPKPAIGTMPSSSQTVGAGSVRSGAWHAGWRAWSKEPPRR